MPLTGIPVTLLQLSRGAASDTWTPVAVDNVLIAPFSEVDTTAAAPASGHRALYHLAIPKTDTHRWEGQLVQFWGDTWSVIGTPTQGLDHLIPGPWNKKVVVELYRSATPDPDSLWADRVRLLDVLTTKDADGYDQGTDVSGLDTTAIFTRLPESVDLTQDTKRGRRKAAMVELWRGDYADQPYLQHDGTLYQVTVVRDSGRGTKLLTLEEVWR